MTKVANLMQKWANFMHKLANVALKMKNSALKMANLWQILEIFLANFLRVRFKLKRSNSVQVNVLKH